MVKFNLNQIQFGQIQDQRFGAKGRMPRKGLKKKDDSDDDEPAAPATDEAAGVAGGEAKPAAKGKGRKKKGGDSDDEEAAPADDWKARKAKQEEEKLKAAELIKALNHNHSTLTPEP